MTAYGFVKKLGLTMERCFDEFDDAGFGLGCQGRSMKYEVLKAERTTTTTTRWLAIAGCRHQRLHLGGCTHRQGLPTLTTTTATTTTTTTCDFGFSTSQQRQQPQQRQRRQQRHQQQLQSTHRYNEEVIYSLQLLDWSFAVRQAGL